MMDRRSIMNLLALINYLLFLFGAAEAAISVPWDNELSKAYELPQDLCTSPIYCNGELLKTVQLADLYNRTIDSKTFVDKHQKQDEQQTLENFKQLLQRTNNKPSQQDVHRFVEENFEDVNELLNTTLVDWKDSLSLEKKVVDPIYKKWISDLNYKWKELARIMNEDVNVNPQRYSLIYVPNLFIIPGGRFREFYYWDTYWIIEGLLLSEMPDTTRGIIDNFLYVVKKYGFIPNGGRVYYLMRSQPPFLVSMVEKYYQHTDDWNYVEKNLPLLEKEFEYFHRFKRIKIKVNVGNSEKEYEMYRYVTNSDGPRPESYREDYNLSLKLTDEEERRKFFNNIKAGAETGWDFSARWFVSDNCTFSYDLWDISTDEILPVDLNSFVEKNARTLSCWFEQAGNIEKAMYYGKIAAQLREAIRDVLWNNKLNMWFDYNIKFRKQKTDFYPSNLTPLYTCSYQKELANYYGDKAYQYLKRENITYFEGGIPASLNYSRQQWDFPNAWAPLQSMIVQGLRYSNNREAVGLAKQLAETWLRSNYIAYNNSQLMYEKYDAQIAGKKGGDGEYEVQHGFGWTNGVVFEFLNTYPNIQFTESSPAIQGISTRFGAAKPKYYKPVTNSTDELILRSVWSHYFQPQSKYKQIKQLFATL